MAQADLPDLRTLPQLPDLPDLLVGAVSAGSPPITDASKWADRRHRLLALLRHYEYGVPPAPVAVDRVIRFEDRAAFDGSATLAEVDLAVGSAPRPVRVLLALPGPAAGAPTRRPVFVGVNFTGNHSVLDDERIAVPDQFASRVDDVPARGSAARAWPLRTILDAGFAVATFYAGDVDVDDRSIRAGGIRPFFDTLPGADPAAPPGSLTAWAWALSRVVDYLIRQPTIEAKSIVAVGHSRFGKVAMLAGATDARIDAVIAHQAGAGGTSPLRTTRAGAERPADLLRNFPHWFTPAFADLADDPTRAPFDQHTLVALAAPRPVLLSNAVEDEWADPAGQLAVRAAVEGVYRLTDPDHTPFEQTPDGRDPVPGDVLRGRVRFSMREGRHEVTERDWDGFLDFVRSELPTDRNEA